MNATTEELWTKISCGEQRNLLYGSNSHNIVTNVTTMPALISSTEHHPNVTMKVSEIDKFNVKNQHALPASTFWLPSVYKQFSCLRNLPWVTNTLNLVITAQIGPCIWKSHINFQDIPLVELSLKTLNKHKPQGRSLSAKTDRVNFYLVDQMKPSEALKDQSISEHFNQWGSWEISTCESGSLDPRYR